MTVELIVQIVCGIIVSVVGWGFLNALNNIKEAIKRNETDIRELGVKFNDFKEKLPYLYILREDHTSAMNNVNRNIADMSQKLDRLIERKQGGVT